MALKRVDLRLLEAGGDDDLTNGGTGFARSRSLHRAGRRTGPQLVTWGARRPVLAGSGDDPVHVLIDPSATLRILHLGYETDGPGMFLADLE